MKPWIKANKQLLALYNGIEKYKHTAATAKPHKTGAAISEEMAAQRIQHLWRGFKVKEAFVKNPYGTYLSMVDPEDEQRLLSSIMFGRHQAELRKNTKDRVPNPLIHENAFYHRCDDLSGELLNRIVTQEFKLTPDQYANKIVYPVTELNTVPVEHILAQSHAVKHYQVIHKSNASIALVLVKKAAKWDIRTTLVSSGLIASPWEIAQHITALGATLPNANPVITAGLPKTKEELLQSNLFQTLMHTAKNRKRATHQLAASVVQLLKQDDVLTPAAIQRIALIIDMANTFYTQNYPRYAFCVYAIIHELSLSMAIQTNPAKLDIAFQQFLNEAQESLTTALGLNEDELNQSTFIASPAMSGTNAFMIAKRIASTMKIQSGKVPSIEMHAPCYYELNTNEFSNTGWSEPDIFVFSTGPIVNLEGLTPGVDINQFVRKKVLHAHRTKPTTLIVDATTTLYKNLHLDPDVKQLVKDGKLSIIVFESHQKFGLLHTDQAQYGRVFGLCAIATYNQSALQDIQNDAKLDFKQHLDLRIGANINHCCQDSLEKIKKQHFHNGAVFKTILAQTQLISNHLVKHNYMNKNLDELYFVTSNYSWESFMGSVPFRNSFGHYSTTLSFVNELARLCANASDNTDALLIATRIYLVLAKINYQSRIELEHLSESEQIIRLAMTQNLIRTFRTFSAIQNPSQTDCAMQYCKVNNTLRTCSALKGREAYEDVAQHFYQLKAMISKNKHPEFLSAMQIAYDHQIPLSEKTLNYLNANAALCRAITNKSLTVGTLSTLTILNEVDVNIDDTIMDLAKHNTQFRELISLVYDTNSSILARLEEKQSDGIPALTITKYNASVQHSPIYLKECFLAIKTFCTESPAEPEKLIQAITQANDTYCKKALSRSRTLAGVLKHGLNKLISCILALISPALRKKTIEHPFFKTESENKINVVETTLRQKYAPKHK
jgi:hypothetical protein